MELREETEELEEEGEEGKQMSWSQRWRRSLWL
jgi:hypothetical protein